MVADKGKKTKVEENDDYSEQVDGELVASIEKLQEVQDELEKLNEEASNKALEVEQRYNEIRKPIYGRRNEAIEKIPDFWLTAFLSHPVLCELLTEEDHKIFKYLKSLEVVDSKDVKSGYSITFNFLPNPYFENAKLTKTFSFDDEGNTTSIGTDIKWKDLDIANGTAHETKGKRQKRPFTEDSFFAWFGEAKMKDVHLIHDEVGDIIKEELWINPLKYFNSEDDFDEDDDEDENGEGNGNMKDGDDDDDDSNDDDED